ncbi:50S ribosomal protein L11 [Candidatus Woesearchaeota archaeon]|nr:50S ribosomal protein L11 [Candidatus Woesearchaeota archaeon]
MPEQVIEVLVEGGKATGGPPIGPALGPLGVNVGQVVGEINKKTASFAGMQVPVKIIVDTDTKQFRIEIGTPPTSSLIRKELGIEKGAQKPGEEVAGNLTIEQVVKIAKMKESALTGKDLKARVKTVIGSAQSMGLTIEGMHPREVLKKIDEGAFDEKLKE